MNIVDTYGLDSHPLPQGRLLTRQQYLGIVGAALMVKQFRFARQLVLDWLAIYPGDLQAGLYYAQALAGEELRFLDGRKSAPERPRANNILQGLCEADPEFLEAVEVWAALEEDKVARAVLFALTGKSHAGVGQELWASQIYAARLAMQLGDFQQAEASIREALSCDPPHPLAAVTHLRLLQASPEVPLSAKSKLAVRYYQRWPDSLAIMLFVADCSLEGGDASLGVALLHQVAARDVGGQVARRIWGEMHPYRRLWPEKMELQLKQHVPGEVAAVLGWNRLPDRRNLDFSQSTTFRVEMDESDVAAGELDRAGMAKETPFSAAAPREEVQGSIEQVPIIAETPDSASEREISVPDHDLGNSKMDEIELDNQEPPEREPADSKDDESFNIAAPEELYQIHQELERIAEGLNLPGLTNLDGRRPVYVVFSVRSRLEVIYGSATAAILETEMQRVVEAVRSGSRDRSRRSKGRSRGKTRQWESRLFFADDPESTTALGIKPARPGDPWALKLALADLDGALARRGEMIGALLIVGGPEIVPFHRLPNPVDDSDQDVPSDNPYGTRDENYFLPEWPVGRLPGGTGQVATSLLGALRRVSARHQVGQVSYGWYLRWWNGLKSWWVTRRRAGQPSFGYTAAVWRRAASSVFRPIGEPEAMHVSPPMGLDGNEASAKPDSSRRRSNRSNRARGIPAPVGRLGYFNLHGLSDAPEWYGQRDPLDNSPGVDYPVALRPADITMHASRSNGGAGSANGIPQVVFSEACYGLHVRLPKAGQNSHGSSGTENSIPMAFLEAGSQVVVGSTCISYGSIGTPLIAADLLGQAFWRLLQEGLPAGEALRQAKLALAHEMDRRQGYLDGEDQKTLLSFILLGDPLAQPPGCQSGAKELNGLQRVRRLLKPSEPIPTVCDRADGCEAASDGEEEINMDVIDSVREVVAKYLPGMEDAEMMVTRERGRCAGKGHACPTSELLRKVSKVNWGGEYSSVEAMSQPDYGLTDEGLDSPVSHFRQGENLMVDKEEESAHRMVTLSKKVERPEGLHAHYARLTLDGKGNVVKMVVSR